MGKGVKALIIILVLIVIGLAAYIVVDKTILNKDTNTTSQNGTTGNANSGQTINTTNTTDNTSTTELTAAENGRKAFEQLVNNKSLETEQHGTYYTYVDPFNMRYNIKEITSYTTDVGMLSNNKEVALFDITVIYIDNNNQNKTMELAVSMDKNGDAACYGTYLNYTGSTNFVKAFTNMYNDGTSNN